MAAQLKDQDLYQSIFESSSQGILVVDNFGLILHANQAIGVLFEYPSLELVGTELETLIPKELSGAQPGLIKKYANTLKRRSFGKFNLLGLKKDGSQLSILINLHPTVVNGKELVIVFVTDTSENLLLAHELEVSEEKNRAILQALPDIIAIQNIEGTFLEVQSANNYQFPYPIQEIKGKKISDFIPDASECKHILRTFQQVIRKKEMEIIEVTIPVFKRIIDLEARIAPFEKDKVLVVLRDITKSKAIQNVLDTRNRALEVAGNGIVIVNAQDPILPIIYCNKSFTELTGYAYEEVIGINCAFLQNDDRDQEAITTMVKAIKNEESCRVVLRNYRKNGTLFWNEVSITPLFNEENKLTHFIGVQNDVTEIIENRKKLKRYTEELEETIGGRTTELKATVEKLVATNQDLKDQMLSTKVAEEKARTSQAMFAAIAQNFPKGVIIVFNTNYELVYIEGEELDRIAIKKSDIIGVKLDHMSFFSDKQKSKLKEDIKKTLGGATISCEVVFQGQSYTVNSTPLFGDDRKIVWVLFVYNNVTEQKKIQQNLEASLKIEQELNELKSRFISMASHEFRTPLSAILSSAILIGKQNESGNEERRLKHVFRIRNNVKNLVIILNDFLSLSRLEEGKIMPVSQHFEFIEFSKLILEEMKTTKKDGQKIVLLTQELKIDVDLDPKLVSHILINLLSNATKYSKENQKVLLEISATSTYVTLTISDKGIGIPKEEQDKLFERFFRATNATNIQGTGLGLHIVKHYVELMGGAVSFTSEIEKGTSFKVKLPLKMVKS